MLLRSLVKKVKSLRELAKVFDGEFLANSAIKNGEIKKGDVIVIRYEGPKGGPGMPEMLKLRSNNWRRTW